MIAATFGAGLDRPLSVLCLGAHSDDIEIGVGGTVLRLLAERPDTHVDWVVFSADDRREDEARASAADYLVGARSHNVQVHRFRESHFPYVGAEIKDAFETLKSTVSPDIVFTHAGGDAHQDHRAIAQLTWNTFRNHMIAEYEIPKYEGDLGQPNLFVPLPEELALCKVDLLMRHFGSQRNKGWFRPETFRGLMALRGVECASESGWAEAFHAPKIVI